jgi:hypothetical protein
MADGGDVVRLTHCDSNNKNNESNQYILLYFRVLITRKIL